jgi:hypothetical protein
MTDEALRTFFRREVVAAGERLRAAGQAVALHPDPELDSYYSRRDPAQPVIFRATDVQIDRIADLWSDSGRDELCPLLPGLQLLWREMETREQSGEPSPLIYAMF